MEEIQFYEGYSYKRRHMRLTKAICIHYLRRNLFTTCVCVEPPLGKQQLETGLGLATLANRLGASEMVFSETFRTKHAQRLQPPKGKLFGAFCQVSVRRLSVRPTAVRPSVRPSVVCATAPSPAGPHFCFGIL